MGLRAPVSGISQRRDEKVTGNIASFAVRARMYSVTS